MIFKEQLLTMEHFGIIMLLNKDQVITQVVQVKLGVKMVKWFLVRQLVQMILEATLIKWLSHIQLVVWEKVTLIN